MKVKKIEKKEDFLQLKDEWNNLVLSNKFYTIFLTWEWLFTWWEYFSRNHQLFILLAYDDNENLLGIAPLMLTGKRYVSLNKFKVVEFISSGSNVCSEYLDFLILPGKEEKVTNAFVDYIWREKKSWDLLNLTNISYQSKTLKLIKNRMDEYTKNNLIIENGKCPYVPIKGLWQDYFKGLNKGFRSEIDRTTKKIKREQEISFDIYDKPNEISHIIDNLMRFNIERLTQKRIKSSFLDANFSAFFKKIIELFSLKHWVKLYCLVVKNVPIAICCNYVFNDKSFHYQNSFNSKYSNYGPTHLLLSYAIEDSFKDGNEEFDFLTGEEPYKYMWASDSKRNKSIIAFKNNIFWNLFLIQKQIKKIIKEIKI